MPPRDALEQIFAELENDAGIPVRDLGHLVFGRTAQNEGRFGDGELIILLKPLHHAGCGATQCLIHRSSDSNRLIADNAGSRGVPPTAGVG